MPVRVVFRCQTCGATPDAGTQRALERSLRELGFGEYLEVLAKLGTSANHVWLVGHNTLRAAVGLTGERGSEDDLRAMEGFVREAMDAGVHGLSTGLEATTTTMAAIWNDALAEQQRSNEALSAAAI